MLRCTHLPLLLLASALFVVCHGGRMNMHALSYGKDDWRPHFGYHRGHYAFEDKHHYKARSTTPMARIDGKMPLDDYVVRIMVAGKLVCNGIIVNKQHVLTVSTCLIEAPVADMSLKLYDGSVYNATGNSTARGYASREAEELLTLIQLGAELPTQFLMAPPLCYSRLKTRDSVELWTWNRRKSQLVKKKAAQVMDDKCKQQITDPDGVVIRNYTSCVVNTQSSKTCQRNFGLPYVHDERFCGINILGHNCPKASSADVYVRLLDEKLFISKKLNMVRRSHIDREIF